jgi:hypothetical protein
LKDEHRRLKMSEIYVLEESIDYVDAVSCWDEIVTIEKSEICEILFEKICHEDFVPMGCRDRHSYRVIEWKGRVSKVLLCFGVGDKESALHFIETF